jgi:hypothetical protein
MEVHRKIVDSVHETEIGSQIGFFSKIVEKRANALLFNEETMNFYQYNLQVYPSEFMKYALSYLMHIMNILLKYNQEVYREMSKLIRKTAKRLDLGKSDKLIKKPCR